MEKRIKHSNISSVTMENRKLINLWLVMGIVMGFLSVLFFVSVYLNNKVLCDLSCRARNEVQIALVLLSLVGMFVGSLTYYFISEKYEKKIGKIRKEVKSIMKFLDRDQRKIVEFLIKNGFSALQSDIVTKTGFTRVQVSRILKEMYRKKIINKEKHGMTNKISLSKDLSELFTR